MIKLRKGQAAMNRSWHWLLGLGILFMLLGLIGISQAVGVTLISILFLGFMIMIAGVAQLVDVFKSTRWKASSWHALVGFFYILAGGLVIFDPILASTIVTLLLAWVFIIIGVIRLIMGISLKSSMKGWFFFFLNGLAAIILGILIIAQWPLSGLWVIGLLISIELIISGWTYVFMAFAIRR